MVATTQEEILSGILPRVSIEKISLTNNSNNLKIEVELNIKEVLDNNFFGSWFDDINIKKYVVIDVVQSTDFKTTEALSFSNDMIQLCSLNRAKKDSNDMRMKVLSYLTGKKNLTELLDILDNNTTTNSISLNEDSRGNSNIKNYPSYTNSDGQKVYEISYKTSFILSDTIEPEHLAYFAVCSIDMQSLANDLKIDYDIMESFEENGKVVSEIVIENSKIAGYSYIYVDSNGVAWSGPVHQNDIGEWRSGDDETQSSVTLSKITVNNTKIQDFRNFAEIQRMFLDFNQQQRDSTGKLVTNAFNLENTLKNITRIQSVETKIEGNTSQFTNIFSSIDSQGNLKFLFGVEFIELLKNYSKFSKLYNSDNEDYKNESISNTKILDLKIYRRRIRNDSAINTGINKLNLQKLDPNEPDELILQTKDESWKNFINLNNEKCSIREAELFVENDSNFMRYFTGTDKTFKHLTDGVYQYYIELELEDGTIQLIKEQLENLSLAKNQLTEYYNKVSKPTMRKFLLETQEPHIDSPRETSNNSVITDYGYDIVLNKLSPQLVSKLIREYGGVDSATAPWASSAAIFSSALYIFSESIKTDEDKANISNFLTINLMPNSTNPSIISKIIELLDYFISSMSNTFDIKLENISDPSPTSPLSAKNNKSFKVVKFFNEIFDSNALKTYNIDYLSAPQNTSTNIDGLTSLTKNAFSQRVSNEMLKFFNTESPAINFNSTEDNSENIKYSFLTPTRLDFINSSVDFSGIQSDNNNQNTQLYDFYHVYNRYEKAISIYADILNFKLDVNGKNRLRNSSKKYERINIPENEALTFGERERLYSSRKINDIFADFSNLTIQSFNIANSNNISIKTNLNSLNNLMSSLSSGAIRSTQSYQSINSVGFKNDLKNIICNNEFDYVKNLANKNINDIRIRNKQVYGLKDGASFKTSKLNKIPNQIRALIFKPQSQLSTNIMNNLNYNSDFSNYIRNKTLNYFNFEMIVEVQYLSGFNAYRNLDITSIGAAMWKNLTKDYLDSITEEKEILCRLIPFSNHDLKIPFQSELEKRCYDKYFIIKTTRAAQQPISFGVNRNSIVNNIINSITDNLPGITIRDSFELPHSIVGLPSSIQIIRTDNLGRRQITDFRDIVARDINRNADIRIGQTTTPAIAVAAVHAVSISSQESNINNNFRSSNHVPNRNIRQRSAGLASRVRQRM